MSLSLDHEGTETDRGRESTRPPGQQRQTACLTCRAVKAKCTQSEGAERCDRCARLDKPCERAMSQRVGRPKGSHSYHATPLERAFKVIERELHVSKRSRREEPDRAIEHGGAAPETPDLAQTGLNWPAFPSSQPARTVQQTSMGSVAGVAPPAGQPPVVYDLAAPSHENYLPIGPEDLPPVSPYSFASRSSQQQRAEHEPEGDLSNPVHVLVEAAEEETTGSPSSVERTTAIPHEFPPPLHVPDALRAILAQVASQPSLVAINVNSDYLFEGLEAMLSMSARRTLSDEDKRFFRPPRRDVNRDLAPEYDPLALALLTPGEAKTFFQSFFQHLHPLLPVLDPSLHTPDFVRTRSAFLFTAICAHGASMTVAAEETTKRLRIHTQRLSDTMSRKRFASVEIVQAFLIWISWLPSSEPFQEERLWHATKYAINMAVELGLDSPVPGSLDEIVAENLTSSKEPQANAWDSVERIIRNRQRLWIHLFLWDANLSLAFGKATRFAQNELIRDENWCFHRLRTKHDSVTTACVVLRKRLVGLTETLTSGLRNNSDATTDWVVDTVGQSLRPWFTHWSGLCEGSAYLGLLYRHTRLWILSYGLQTMPSSAASEGLALQCFHAALDSCEFVCDQLRNNKDLWGLPNSIGPMLSFEAVIAIRLFPSSLDMATGRKACLLGLLAQLSLLLERVGSTPPHRLGIAAVYGRHLQVFVRRRVVSLCAEDRNHANEGTTFDVGSFPLPQVDVTTNQFFNADQLLPMLHPINTINTPSSYTPVTGNPTTFDASTSTSWPDMFSEIFGAQI